MALNWNVSECEDYESMWVEVEGGKVGKDGKPLKRLNATTESIIWTTMVVDVGHLKNEAECREYYTRFIEYCAASHTEPYLTWPDVLRHKGLSCNVFRTTKAKWKHRIASLGRDYAERRVEREMQEIAKAIKEAA